MLPVMEQPMIERVLGQLAAHGIEDAVLSLGYRPDAFINAYPDGSAGGVRLSYAVEPEPLDTAGAIRFAADHAGVEDTFVVVNGDVLTDLDITALVNFHHSHHAEATISLTPVEDPSSYGVVPTDAQGKVEAFIEKPPRDEVPTNLINAGTYVLEPEVLARIPKGRRVSIERETFPSLVEAGTLFALGSDVYWIDTGCRSRPGRGGGGVGDRRRIGRGCRGDRLTARFRRPARARCSGRRLGDRQRGHCRGGGDRARLGPAPRISGSGASDGGRVDHRAGRYHRSTMLDPAALCHRCRCGDAVGVDRRRRACPFGSLSTCAP
jgi:mannose-1-phosphate guanylyltransferase